MPGDFDNELKPRSFHLHFSGCAGGNTVIVVRFRTEPAVADYRSVMARMGKIGWRGRMLGTDVRRGYETLR